MIMLRATSSIVFRVLAFAALTCALDASASAAQPTEVEDLIRRGGELRKKGEDAKALPLYQRAYELAATPRTAAQLGLVETQLGYRLEADAHLDEALAARDDLWVNRYRSVLENTLRQVRAGIGEVDVIGSPPGAEVSINGHTRGRLPLERPVRIAAGPARVEIRAEGFTSAGTTVVVRGQSVERVTLNLAPVVVKDRAIATEPVVAKDSAPGPTGAQADARTGLRVAAWSTAGAALVFVAAGVIELSVASRKLDEFRSTPASDDPSRSCGSDQARYGGDVCLRLHEDWSRARTMGLIGLIGGGLLAGTSATLFVVSSSPSNHRVACGPVFGVGVTCAGRF